MISRAKSFTLQVSQAEREGKVQKRLLCAVLDRHTQGALAGFSLPPPRPTFTQRAMKGTTLQPGVWTLEAKRLWEKEIQILN